MKHEKTTAFGYWVRKQWGIRHHESGHSATSGTAKFVTSYSEALALISDEELGHGESWEIQAVEVTVSVGVEA